MTDLYLRQNLHLSTLQELLDEPVNPGFLAWIDGYGRYTVVPAGFGIADGYYIIDGYDNVQWVNDFVFDEYVNLDGYATINYVDGYLSNYTTKSYVDGYISNYTRKTYVDGYVANYTKKTYVDGYFSNYSTKSYVDGYVASVINSITQENLFNSITQEWTTAGTYTWTKPAGCTMVDVLLVGGGGGGGAGTGGSNLSGDGGGGGGSGMVARYLFKSSDLPSTVSVVVGAGGTGGPFNISEGGNQGFPGIQGGNSSFGWLVAYGGAGGCDHDSVYQYGGGGAGYAGGGGGAGSGYGGGIGTIGYHGLYGSSTVGGAGGSSNIRSISGTNFTNTYDHYFNWSGCDETSAIVGYCGGGAVGGAWAQGGGVPYGYGAGGSGGAGNVGQGGGGGGGDGYNPFATRTAGPAGNAGGNSTQCMGGAGLSGYVLIRSW